MDRRARKTWLAANDLIDCMKRQSQGSSMKRWIAHGPASAWMWERWRTTSAQKQSAERNAAMR